MFRLSILVALVFAGTHAAGASCDKSTYLDRPVRETDLARPLQKKDLARIMHQKQAQVA